MNKVPKNNSSGDLAESFLTRKLHHDFTIPILVSPKLLRSLNLGQIDVALIKDQKLQIVEIKNRGDLSPQQKRRLWRSCIWLAQLLNRDKYNLWLVKKILPNKFSFFNLNDERF
jgi:hypothetical protein